MWSIISSAGIPFDMLAYCVEQAEIQQLERTRESMARELVNLTNLNEQLQEEVKELPLVRTNLKVSGRDQLFENLCRKFVYVCFMFAK